MPRYPKLTIFLVLVATSPYTGAYLAQGAVAVHQQIDRFRASQEKKQAEDAHTDAVACGQLPLDETDPAAEPTPEGTMQP